MCNPPPDYRENWKVIGQGEWHRPETLHPMRLGAQGVSQVPCQYSSSAEVLLVSCRHFFYLGLEVRLFVENSHKDCIDIILVVRSLIIERYPERLAAPKAHAINPRSLEILRQFALGEKRVRQLGTSRDDSSWVNFLTNLCGDEIGRLPYERMDPAVLNDTPEVYLLP